MSVNDFMQLRPDSPGYVNYTEAGKAAAADNKPKSFDASKTFRSIQGASGLGARQLNSNTSESRMSLPLSDVAQSANQRFGKNTNTQTTEIDETAKNLSTRQSTWNQDLAGKNAIGNQDINLNIRRVKEYEPLANNEANRAMGMSLATQFPYKKYENESSSARDIMNSSLGAIPTFLNRATASRLNPVSMSL